MSTIKMKRKRLLKLTFSFKKKKGKKNVDKDYSASSMIVLGQQLKTKNLLCDIFDVNWHSRAFTLSILAAFIGLPISFSLIFKFQKRKR